MSVRGIKDTRAILVIASHRSSTAQYINLFICEKKGGSDGIDDSSDSFSDHFEILFPVTIKKNI